MEAAIAVPLAQARQAQLAADLAGGADPVRADADRIQQIAWNLLTNAVKFTPCGGRVAVSLQRAGACVELQVRDNGVGIEPQFLPFVFDRFRQGTMGSARRHSGLGLGLAIAKQLVELHGGTISAESRGVGQGAVCLRLGRPPSGIQERAGARREPGLPDLSRVEVLVVDDEPSARAALARQLEQCGTLVRAVASCAATREAVTLHRPERRLPALAVTAFARQEDRQRALAASFDDHLPKPVDPDRLVAAVATLARI